MLKSPTYIGSLTLDSTGRVLAEGFIVVDGVPCVVLQNLLATLPAIAVAWNSEPSRGHLKGSKCRWESRQDLGSFLYPQKLLLPEFLSRALSVIVNLGQQRILGVGMFRFVCTSESMLNATLWFWSAIMVSKRRAVI